MELKTASAVIKYLSEIEDQSARWYLRSARRHPGMGERFNPFAAENKKFAKRLQKAYYSGITDALETNFSFQGLEAGIEIPEAADSASQLLKQSLDLESSIGSFYLQAAELSRDLLADLARAMQRVGRAREQRIAALRAMQQR